MGGGGGKRGEKGLIHLCGDHKIVSKWAKVYIMRSNMLTNNTPYSHNTEPKEYTVHDIYLYYKYLVIFPFLFCHHSVFIKVLRATFKYYEYFDIGAPK